MNRIDPSHSLDQNQSTEHIDPHHIGFRQSRFDRIRQRIDRSRLWFRHIRQSRNDPSHIGSSCVHQ